MVTFRNSYGELPAAQIAKLPFYGGLTIVYAVIGWYVPFERKLIVALLKQALTLTQLLGIPLLPKPLRYL